MTPKSILSINPTIRIIFFCFVVLAFNNVYGAIRLPNTIASNMVLQQKSKTTIWGWSSPLEKIYITTSWNNQKDSVVADVNAKWKLDIATPQAGGPYTITLQGQNIIVLENIMIGEVWICSGQSNMEWSSEQGLKQIVDEIPNSQNNNIRLFQVAKTTAAYPQDYIEGAWKVCGPDALKGFSAVAYFFAKALQQKLNVPVAVINTSWGGTPAEPWTPADIVNGNSELAATAAMQKNSWWAYEPGYTYNAMIYPLTHMSIAGAIWYQGESNTSTAFTYEKLFSSMIQSWRTAWKKDFPFYYVQIAPFSYEKNNVGALLREQQTKTLQVPNTGMVVITDLVDDVKNIHPTNKKDVALRLANYALAETYNNKNITAYKSPLFNRMEVLGKKAYLYFDNAPNGFKLNKGKTATDFYIAGADKVFVPAIIKIEKNRLVASAHQIKNPVAVRFSFSNGATSNIFSKEGLPLSPFRTDNWAVDTSILKQ